MPLAALVTVLARLHESALQIDLDAWMGSLKRGDCLLVREIVRPAKGPVGQRSALGRRGVRRQPGFRRIALGQQRADAADALQPGNLDRRCLGRCVVVAELLLQQVPAPLAA